MSKKKPPRPPNKEVTSKRVAKVASKVLRDPRYSKNAKTTAGSALTQRPDKPKKR